MLRLTDLFALLPFSVFVPPLYAYSTRELPPVGVPMADGFDFPVGPPDATGYHDAQSFGVNQHLGEDWNGDGGATDLGDPVHSIATGRVTFVGDLGGGWGNVVRIAHGFVDRNGVHYVESFYAHLAEVHVVEGQQLRRGTPVGTIGDADGVYIPHLHFELRARVGMPHGPGYASERDGWLDPTGFILAHRPDGGSGR